MEMCEARRVSSILDSIWTCEQGIKRIEDIKTYDIHINDGGASKVSVLPEVKGQIKEIAINAYKEKKRTLKKN